MDYIYYKGSFKKYCCSALKYWWCILISWGNNLTCPTINVCKWIGPTILERHRVVNVVINEVDARHRGRTSRYWFRTEVVKRGPGISVYKDVQWNAIYRLDGTRHPWRRPCQACEAPSVNFSCFFSMTFDLPCSVLLLPSNPVFDKYVLQIVS